MHYYIDGYNLLFAVINSKETLEKKRETIIKLIQKYLIPMHVEATLVFDSNQEDIDFHDIDTLRIVFTRKKLSADQYILDELSLSANTNKETVVTSDRELSRLAKNLKAHTLSISSFIEKIKKINHKRKKKIHDIETFADTESNIQRLLKIFEKK